MKKKGWFSVLQNLSWLTQLGLSLAAPPVLCLLGAGWLARRFSLGPWVYFAAIVLGVGAAAGRPHTATFNPDEGAIDTGMDYMKRLALQILKK